MAFQREAMVVLVVFMAVMAGLQVTEAVTYTVGDATGWTTIGNYNYTQWSSTKTFAVGDVLIFKYNKAFHNVIQVSHEEYNACNTTSPVATYVTGDDTVKIQKTGHFYYLCGVPGHCQAGQKVDIRVVSTKGSNTMPPTGASMPPSTTVSEPTAGPTTARAPAPSAAPTFTSNGALGFAALTMAIFAGFLTV